MRISRRVHATSRRLRCHNEVFSPELKAMLVTMVFPHLDYCCLVYNDVSATFNARLQRLMNSAIRFVFSLCKDVHIISYRLKLGWLTVADRRLFFLCFLHQVLATSSPAYLRELFLELDPVLRRSARLAESDVSRVLHIPQHRTITYRNSFLLSVSYLWNDLPVAIRSSISPEVFEC